MPHYRAPPAPFAAPLPIAEIWRKVPPISPRLIDTERPSATSLFHNGERHMRRIRASCFAAVFVCLNAIANTFGNDRSEAWWIPAESEWGALMVQQQGVIFVSSFIYGTDRQPTWFSATLTFESPSQTYFGDLIASTGPSYAEQVFERNTVTRTVVGSARLVAVDWDHAILTYTVGTQVITKPIERLTWAWNQLGGHYYRGFVGAQTNCNPSSLNGFY